MVHILFDRLDFSADFLYQTFRHYLHPEDTVVIPAFPTATGMSTAWQTGTGCTTPGTGSTTTP